MRQEIEPAAGAHAAVAGFDPPGLTVQRDERTRPLKTTYLPQEKPLYEPKTGAAGRRR
jgi:hypothetical protein